ncbi:SGNH/GDSL hydrolase family protein [Methylophilus flavus]|uniref:SGNH/GDSL hydrolase family protein n=1 Tax=Methylophilus flavus TaxID=640084 RepID=A0ABW3PF98_9PROT
MQHILVYSDSLTWGIIPDTRQRLAFEQRWPGVMEIALTQQGHSVRVIEDCLNGRRTVFEDPLKPGRNGQQGLAERLEIHSPLSLVILMLGTNDFQSMHPHTAWHASQGIASLIHTIRNAPVEPGMPVPPVLVVAPPPLMSAKGSIAPKFKDAETKCIGLASALEAVCVQLNCAFFDAGSIVTASQVDGIHLDADQHAILGLELARQVNALLR